MMMSSMTSNGVMLRSIHQIKDHSLTIPWYWGGGGGEWGGHLVLRGKVTDGGRGNRHQQSIKSELTVNKLSVNGDENNILS